jgi:hypothetical protein
MKKPPPIKGLLAEIEDLRTYAVREAVASRSEKKCPRAAHEAAVNADRAASKADALEKWAEEDADLITQLHATASFIRLSPNNSALRALALRKIEDAEMILRREIGDAP